MKTGTPCTVTATENSKRIWCEEIMLDDFQAAFDQHTQKLSQNPNDWRANLFMCFMNCRAYKYAEPEFNLAISQLEKACKSIEGDLSIPEESRQYFKHKGVLELYNSISDYIVKLDAKREDMNGTRIIRVFHVKDRTYLENILDKMQECLPICQRILDLIISDNYSTNSKDFNEIINATAINIMGLCDALRMIAQEVMQTDIMKQ